MSQDTALPENARVAIVGAGHAGGTAAALLRQFKHTGPVTLIGAEEAAPYQRPPLSKAFLKGDAGFESLLLKPDAFYEKHEIDLRTGVRAEGIDRAARRVLLPGGESLAYDALILATGSRNRALPALTGMPGVHELRSLKDALGLQGALGPGRKLVIVGGGYIGLEAAASAIALGAEAVIVEREPRVLARTASPELAAFFEDFHRKQGVQILTGASVAEMEAGEDGHVRAVRLEDGTRIDCDAVLVGVGAQAEDAMAADCGLACEGGVVVDLQARTADPSVFAVGDMTLRPMPLYENRMFRLESVPNALEQARQAASAITGRPAPKAEAPWFWSDQFDLKLQIAGLPFEADEIVTRGDPSSGKFAIFHLKGGGVRAVEAVNAPDAFMGGRMMLLAGTKVDAERLADPEISVKEAAG